MRLDAKLSALAIVAMAGSSAGAQVINWGSAIDGNWNDSFNWVGSNVPNVVGEDAVLGLAGAYAVDMTNSFVIGALSLTNPAASLELGSGLVLTLHGDLLNEGFIFVNEPGSVFDAFLRFNADAMVSGAGSIRLGAIGNPADAQFSVSNGFTVTNGSGHTIHGSGLLFGTIVNNGFIIADDAVGAGLRIAGTLTQGAGGSLGANTGTLLLGSGSAVSGGSMSSINGGQIRVEGGTATIGDVINSGNLNILGGGDFLSLSGDVTNTGTITINSNISVFNAHLRFDTDASISGVGTIRMEISASDLNDAQLFTSAGFTGTIGAGQTVEGSGRIDGRSGGNIVNLGTFIANDPGKELQLLGLISGNGTYNSNDGIMGLGAGLILDGGTFDSTGAGIAKLVSNGVATLSNVTNNGAMGVNGNGGTVALAGPMTNNGTFNINDSQTIFNGHLRFDASAAIDGTGTVHMFSTGDLSDAQIFTGGIFIGTIGADQTVDGSGRVDGRSGGTIVNNGVINGNHAIDGKSPAVRLRLEGNHDGSGGGVYRSDDGILDLGGGLILDGGTFDSSGVGVVTKFTNGVATLSNVTNLGEMGIRGEGGFISLVGPMVNDGTLTINSNSNIFNAHLRIDATTAITGDGTIRMQLGNGDLSDAQLYTGGVFSGTIGAGQTVEGAGRVDGRDGGTIVNLGTINGNDPVNELRLEGNHIGSGVYRSDDGVLGLPSGLVMDGGTFDSSGTGSVEMTTNGTATLSNMINIGTMGIRGQGGVVGLAGPLTNNGMIQINSNANFFNAHIRFLAATEINGTGTIEMQLGGSDFGDAQILNDQGFIGTIGAGQTITGTGRLQGEMNMNGTLDPGSTFRRFDIDTLHLSATSAMIADLGGLLAGEFDRLLLSGADTINLDGTLTVNLDAGYVPEFLDTWDIVDGGTINGEFALVNFPPSPIGLDYKVIYDDPTRVFVVLTCAVDLNGDGALNFLDVSAFLGFYGDADVRGDINGDGNFNFLDVSLFLQIYGGGCAAP